MNAAVAAVQIEVIGFKVEIPTAINVLQKVKHFRHMYLSNLPFVMVINWELSVQTMTEK